MILIVASSLSIETHNEDPKVKDEPSGATSVSFGIKSIILLKWDLIKNFFQGVYVEGQSKPISIDKNIKTQTNSTYKNKSLPRKGATFEESSSTKPIQVDNSEKTLISKKTSLKSKQSVNSTLSPSTISNKGKVKPVKEEVAGKVNSTKKPIRKPKLKPLVTKGGKEADEPIPASPTNKSPFGMPRKIDYIVPAVITITALPLLGIAFYILYKRGRDFWDKRHYRRMDFLIDGMYNE